MIASLKGIVEVLDSASQNGYVIVDVSGVGYKVLVATPLLSKLHIGDSIKLFIHTHVKENALELYGFSELVDLKLFGLLISVSGVGPKTALGIFSAGTQEQIVQSITNGDVSFFTLVPRLGKKNAQKIIIELKSKLGSSVDFDISGASIAESDGIIDALKSFGFSTSEIQNALKQIKGQGKTTEEKIRLALKELGK